MHYILYFFLKDCRACNANLKKILKYQILCVKICSNIQKIITHRNCNMMIMMLTFFNMSVRKQAEFLAFV